MNYDEESYNSAVSEQWEKLAQAQTKEEIQAVLDTWPVKSDFEIEEEDEDSSSSSSEERK